MPKAKTKKVIVSQEETPVPELFLTELEPLKKVRIKDGWGNTGFFIKGTIPSWVKDVDVGELKPQASSRAEKILNQTLQEIVDDCTGTGKAILEVHSIVPVAIMGDDRFYIAVQLITEEEKLLMQRVYFDYLMGHYPKLKFYILQCKEDFSIQRLILAKVKEESIALIAPIGTDSVKIVAPDELLTLFKEWTINGITERKDLDKYKHP